MELFEEALETHRAELNSLNVFPVPDGDTGTNMLLTQRAVTSAVRSSPAAIRFEAVGSVVSRASLMGARGNSGVILSQILRGMCEAFRARTVVGGKHLAAALEHATHEAYRAVTKPADGTMLTVLRDATAAARTATAADDGVVAALSASLVAARKSLNRTRTTNPDLGLAGVVDAGGKGIVLLLDALRSAVTGEPMTEAVGSLGPVGTEQHGAPARASTLEYEVQYLLEGRDDDLHPLREALGTLGESVVVVGGGGLFNVHVHTDDPDQVIRAGERTGLLRDVSVVSLAHQVEACLAGQARAVRVAEETSLVALADGDGVVRALESLGALVMHAESGIQPSVERLLGVIDTVPADSVIVLPNHPNAVAAAERAAVESLKRVVVVPTRSISAGLSAAAAFNPVVDAEENLRTLKEVLAGSRSGEVYISEGDGDMSNESGDWIGVADEVVVYTGPSMKEAAIAVARSLVDRDAELLTLIIGASARPQDEQAVRDAIVRSHPDLRIEVLAGRQQRHAFLIGVE